MPNLTKTPSLHIPIDESGSFASATAPGAWNCVAAYVSPERDRRKVEQCLADLKATVKNPKHAREIKLGEASVRRNKNHQARGRFRKDRRLARLSKQFSNSGSRRMD